MTRERAKELLPIFQAYAEGKPIQYNGGCGWIDYRDDNKTSGLSFDVPGCHYRIKPEPMECYVRVFSNGEFGSAYPLSALKIDFDASTLVKFREVTQ